MKDVWFRYGNDSPWILQGASLVVEPGESVAITGPSGSGKTTLLHLMIGLLEPARGEVLFNGRDVKTIASADLARVIGVVMQDDTLFQGTVADNVSFFDAPIDFERVARAARQANVAADIEAMPMQYHSMLAEAGADISGGQKQRLFIARALYHAPRILFLDEATSHLDPASEALVTRAVEAMDDDARAGRAPEGDDRDRRPRRRDRAGERPGPRRFRGQCVRNRLTTWSATSRAKKCG